MRRSIFLLFVLTAMITEAQHPAVSQPGYDPTVPTLISLRHKAVSFRNEPLEIGIPDIEQKRNKEEISIYMVYEKESSVGTRTPADSELFNPPAKLMDFYLMYDYTYKMYWTEGNNIDMDVPKITISPEGSVESVRVVNYFLDEKGRLKDKALKKSAVNSRIENGALSFELDKSQLKDKSILEIKVQVKTRDFAELTPSLTELEKFERSITISYPIIFNYSVPKVSAFEVESRSASGFELLQFHRVSKGGKGTIEKIKVESSVHTCGIGPGPRPELQFSLEALAIPANADIGIIANDIISVVAH